MTDVRTSSATITRLKRFAFVSLLAAVGLFGTGHFAFAAGLAGTDVQPASLVAGATSTVTVSFATTTTIPANGKIKVTFGANFNIAGASGGTCSTMDGSFITSVAGQIVTLTRQNDGTPQASGVEACTIGGIVNPPFSGSAGTYTIQTTDASNVELDIDATVAADTITVGALSTTNVAPATLVAGASGTTTVTFTTANPIPNNGVIKIIFGSDFNVSGAAGGTCSTQDGTFVTTVLGPVVILTRQSNGTSEPAGAQSCTIGTIVNPAFSGSTGTYIISTFLAGGIVGIDTDAAVGADTITVGALSTTNVAPATLVAGASGTTTVTFTTANAIPNNGVIKVTFGSGFTVSGAAGGTCSTQDGTFVTTVSGQVVTLTRQADGTSEPAGAQSCTIGTIVNPAVTGTTGTYTIATFLTGGSTGIDIDAAVSADTITVAALSSTNVAPGSTTVGTTNTVTVTFTATNPIPSTGKIKVTFGSGFILTNVASTSATCSTMDGAFTASVAGQIVTITRSTGTSEPAGAQSCTIALVQNPVTAGTTGTYTILTTNTSDASIDTDAAVTADTMFAASSSSNSSSSTPLTYDISLSAPAAATAYSAGDAIAVTWSTNGGTGTVAGVNLDYSTDGGSTFTSIVSGTANDGSYTWTAPDISAQSVTIRAQATDLLTVLDADTSDAFSIGTEASGDDTSDDTTAEDTDTSAGSTTLLPTGTFFKGESWSTVYYVDADGTRRPFLDAQTFFTYTDTFDAVIEASDDYLANYVMGAPMLPKAGTVLVKIQSVNNVYALEADSTLRWITSESIASSLYGSNWADYVIDVPVTAWGHFTIGDDINSVNEIEVDDSILQTRDELNSK